MFQKEHYYTVMEHHVLKLHYNTFLNVPPDMTFVCLSAGLHITARNVKYMFCYVFLVFMDSEV